MAKKNQKLTEFSNIKQEPVAQYTSNYPLRKPFRIGCLIIVIILLHIHVFSNFDYLLNIRDDTEFLYFLKIRNLKLAFLIILTFSLLVITIRHFSNRILINTFSILLWLLLFLYGFELYLSAYPPSQGNGDALVSKIWFRKYWKTNQYGFRDNEYIAEELRSRKNILFYLGDSFVAGHGIKKPEDRTFDLLKKSIGTDYLFINAGKNGLSSLMEYSILKSFPAQPKVVILAHVPNDIEDLLPEDKTYNYIYQSSSMPFGDFVYKHSRNSVFGDLLYYFLKVFIFTTNTEDGKDAKKIKITPMYEWYKKDSIFFKHLSTIQQIADYSCDTLDAKFILITYPENYVIDSCDIHINKKIIENLRPNKKMYFLNLAPVYKQTSTFQMSVNMFDGHPSKLINRIVADSLKRIMESDRFLHDK